MKRFVHIIHVAWASIVFITLMLIVIPLALPPLLTGTRAGVISFFFFRWWARIFSILSGIRYQIKGTRNIDRHQPYIFVSNHTSYLDAPGLVMAIPSQFRPLGKRELLRIPIFGLVVRAAAVVVDRTDPESRKRSRIRLKRVLDKGISILIFPEGTQNKTTSILQPFHAGAFRISVETGTPILPIALIGAARLLPPGGLGLKPGKIKVLIGQPLLAHDSGEPGVQWLQDETFKRMTLMITGAGPEDG